MLQKFWFWIKKVYKVVVRKIFSPKSDTFSIDDTEVSIGIINDKIELLSGTNENKINVASYKKYFDFLEKLGLKKDFDIVTTYDETILYATIFYPILINKNNNKVVIFCHGLTNNRWSLFYTMHLTIQRGYKVVSYDARNHGISEKSSTSLGQIESCDLQDVINWVKKKHQSEKIGLYGFSMGAATCIFWTSYFAGAGNSEVIFAICEAPFDRFVTQWKRALGKGLNYYWKHFILKKIIKETLRSSREKLEKVNPYLSLPQDLPIKLLLLHGLEDAVIGWQASLKIHNQISKNKFNKNKINLYLCYDADHGELPFLADNVPNSLRWKKKRKKSKYNFTNLFCSYLEKNL